MICVDHLRDTVLDRRPWVIDTSTYTHLGRAGHADIIEKLAPNGIVVVPDDVNTEIEKGRSLYGGIPAVSSVGWAKIAVLSDEEVWTQIQIRAEMGGQRPNEHVGECAVIACAYHRDMVAILDERAAVAQADRLGVRTHDTLWIVVEAYKTIFEFDRDLAACVVDDLVETGMKLPIDSGLSLFTWAYEEELLP